MLEPTVEPRATEHIEEMKKLIEALVKRGHAYAAKGHVLFNVPSMPDYGQLSNRHARRDGGRRPRRGGALQERSHGLRAVETVEARRAGMALALRHRGAGRPGWHIECSAMAEKHLGPVFDIHGGGIDLVFPHHENEIAQSRCAHGTPVMARTWLHNGFLQVEGEKMSKSLGNFITIHELLDEKKFGGSQWHGLVIRLAMLGTHYRQPIDWTADRLVQARATLMDFADLLHDVEPAAEPHPDVIHALSDDLNTPSAALHHPRAGEVGAPQSRGRRTAQGDAGVHGPLSEPDPRRVQCRRRRP